MRCTFCGEVSHRESPYCAVCGRASPPSVDGPASARDLLRPGDPPIPADRANRWKVLSVMVSVVAIMLVLIVVSVVRTTEPVGRSSDTAPRPAASSPASRSGTVPTTTAPRVQPTPRWQILLPAVTGSAQEWIAPLIVDDVVIASSRSGRVIAFDRDTGATRWDIQLRESQRLADEPPLATGDSIALIRMPDQLIALDAATGANRWVRARPKPSTVEAHQGRLFVDDGATVVSLDPLTGATQWEAASELAFGDTSKATNALVGEGDHLVVASAHAIRSLDVHTGTEQWRLTIAASGTQAIAATIGGTSGTVVVLRGDGVFLGVDTSNGTKRWMDERTELVDGGGILVRGRDDQVIADGRDGLLAFGAVSGTFLWSASGEAQPRSSRANGFLVVYIHDSGLSFFDTETGRRTMTWAFKDRREYVGDVVLDEESLYLYVAKVEHPPDRPIELASFDLP